MAETKIENRKTKIGGVPIPPSSSIRDFTDLVAWKLGRELRKKVYEFTRGFPAEEKHVLGAQLRRAAISVTANLAEGYGRYSYQENMQFCRHARGSAYEVRDHLTTALDAGHISKSAWQETDELAKRVILVLNGYIRATRQMQRQAKEG
jgi:four helix bundle protein